MRSSDTTNGGENGSSNGSNSNGCNENGSSGDPGSSGDSGGNSCGDSGGNSGGDSGGNSPRRCRNNGVSSNDGSDHGFFDTGEEGEPFSDELVNEGSDELVNEGSDELANEGGSSEEGYLENALSAGAYPRAYFVSHSDILAMALVLCPHTPAPHDSCALHTYALRGW